MEPVESDEQARPWYRQRLWQITVAVLAVMAVVIGYAAWDKAREDAERVDGYYCTLSGVGPSDRGPETGRLCSDLLGNG